MSQAPAEVWLRPGPTWDSYSTTAFPDQPDAVRYVRADLYEALQARHNGLMERMGIVDATGKRMKADDLQPYLLIAP